MHDRFISVHDHSIKPSHNTGRSQKNYADAEGLLYRQKSKLLRLIVPQVHKSVCLKKYVANLVGF